MGHCRKGYVSALHIAVTLVIIMFLLVAVWYFWLLEENEGGLGFTISLDREVYAPGEAIEVTFTVENIGSEPVSVSHIWPPATLLVSIWNSSGYELYPRPLSTLGFPDEPIVLMGGENHTVMHDIRTLYTFDFTPDTYIINATYMNRQNNDTTSVSRTIEFRVEEPGEPYALVTFGTGGSNVTFTCEIADDSAERSEGLMYRTELASDHGMLFVFDHTQEVQFWMKNTLIPLDIIFIDNNGVVLNIVEADPEPDVTDSLLTRYASLGPVKYVVEINKGLSAQYGIVAGTEVHIQYVDP